MTKVIKVLAEKVFFYVCAQDSVWEISDQFGSVMLVRKSGFLSP